ncbi:MAG: hypothetical protein VX325_05550 [Bacteroidota bacterium]|nr:hypothetical protein [Bacteroidota bacterium]
MKKFSILAISLILTSFFAGAQDWKYASISWIRTTPGENYNTLLNEKWAKLAQKRIDDGTIVGWDVWGVGHTTPESPYNVIIVTLANEVDSLWANTGFRKIDPDMTDMDVEVMSQKNFKARKIMGEAVVARKNGYSFVDSLPQIAVFNYMKVPLGYGAKYEKMENDLNRSPDKNAPRVAWSYSKRLDLNGENVRWNYITADFYKSYKAAMQARANTPSYSKDLLQAFKSRELVKSEMVWKMMSLR